MRVYRFDAEVSRPIDTLGSDFRLAPLTGMDDGVRVVVFHLAPGGRVGRHAAVTRQLVCVGLGSAWAAGADGVAVHLPFGYAALFEQGEEHEIWTKDQPVTAFVLEGEFSVPLALVKGAPIVVDAHDPAWREQFEQIKAYVSSAFDGMPVSIEHVGSTSVPGLAAKPIIDVDVVVPTVGRVRAAIDRLESLGYRHRGDLGVVGREAFLPPSGVPRQHLYVVVEGNQAHRDHIELRDHLRANPADAARYAELKLRLSTEVGDDMEAYVDGKHELIEELLTAARNRQAPH